jgi:hypothetical protein
MAVNVAVQHVDAVVAASSPRSEATADGINARFAK